VSTPIDMASATDGAVGPHDRPADARSALRRGLLAASLVSLFGSADTAIADDLLQLGEWLKVPGGDRLFDEGDRGDSMYIVVAGRLVAIREGPSGCRHVVGQIRPGESVGEMGLLATQPRAATVQASRDSVVIRISEPAFQRVLSRHPQLLAGAARLVIRRTMEMLRDRAPVERPRSVAVVTLRRGLPGAEFVERLRRALDRRGRALVIDRRRAQGVLAANGASPESADEQDLVLSAWLDAQEIGHDCLLFQAEALPDPWTQRCVRQADVVLLIAAQGEQPEPSRDEHALPVEHGARRELVLLHPPGARAPTGTARWLGARDVVRHHHVRWDRDDDFRRLARFLSGEAVGLVLGGGGARGFAHLGVVRALREAGIPIDATIERVHRAEFTRRNPIGDYALIPHVALVRGKRLDAALRRGFGAYDIADTWRPFFCVSTDLTLARSVIHRRGPLWKALRAGVSIPGLLPPVVMGDHLHVDGGLLDNLPVEAMHASGVGRIVAVDLTVKREIKMTRGEVPSVLQFLRERLRAGEGPTSPGIGSILVKSALMSSAQRAREHESSVDLYLAPEPSDIGFLEWKALDRGVALGYRYAQRALAQRDFRTWVDPGA
jgi:predicted acylesterase/phospholipase RssA/CRP-like cAMP-binding protein